MELKTKLNYLRVAPRKMRLIAGAVRGTPASAARIQIAHLTQRAAKPLAKLIDSALANAKHNFGLEKDQLYIKEIRVNQGPALKRSMPRAYGRSALIKKQSSHVTLVLETKENNKTIKNKKAK